MSLALSLAEKAAANDEVPVGAVIVKDQNVIATAFNSKESNQCATDHAEMMALQHASRYLNSWRLIDCDLYVTLEPCLMCAGAIYQARLKNIYFGAYDPKAGAFGSLYQIHKDMRLNHHVNVYGGILAEQSGQLLRQFFAGKRTSNWQSSSFTAKL